MWIETDSSRGALMPGCVRLQAKFGQKRATAETLWFDVPETLRDGVSNSGNFWLQAVLPLAFRLQQPLESNIAVDSIWLRNAQLAMEIWRHWWPELKPIEINAPVSGAASPPASGRTGLFFTGGVDSFYSLLRLSESAGPDSVPVDDLIYVCGFDIPLRHRLELEAKTRTLSALAAELGKNFISLATNLRETQLRQLDWAKVLHGPALGAAALVLENYFSRVFISASFHTNDDMTPWGTHPLTDKLLSSSRTRFIHYRPDTGRFAKTRLVAQSDTALRHLHVCWTKKSHTNCGECEKCLRTMLTLEILGVLENAPCFPKIPLLDRVRNTRVKSPVAMNYLNELQAPANEHGRSDVAEAIETCLSRNRRQNALESPFEFFRNAEWKFRKMRKAWLS